MHSSRADWYRDVGIDEVICGPALAFPCPARIAGHLEPVPVMNTIHWKCRHPSIDYIG
jgi:hypothetical protein